MRRLWFLLLLPVLPLLLGTNYLEQGGTYSSPGGGSGDITDVGDCSTGACFKSGGTGTALFLQNATSGSVTLQTVAGALGTRTISFPAETGTVCTTGSVCSGYAGVAGSDTQVIFNDGGSTPGGDAGLTYDKTNDILTNTHTSLGTTSTDGLVLTNTTAAAVGAQQISPRLRLHASGWKTNATAAARNVDWVIENLPVQGAANPDTALKFGFSLNNASYIYPMWYYVGPNNYTMVLRYNADATAPVDTQGTAALEIQSSGVLHFSSTNAAAQIRFVNDTSLGISNTGTTILDFHAGSVLSLLKLAGAQFTMQLDGQSGRTLGMSRHTTAANAGNTLTVQAGGAKSASTDKAGGDLLLSAGIPTGQGRSTVRLQGYVPATASGTSDETQVDRQIVGAFKQLTNNSATSIMNMTLASGTVVASALRFAVEVTDGTDYQIEEGFITCHVTNKAGTIANNVCNKSSNQQATTAGTLTVTFTVTAANPAVIQVNANSSLTPSTGFPRLTYTYDQLTQQSVSMQ